MPFIFFFILGAVLGSFSLVFADRLVGGGGPFGRSRCDHCKVLLRASDMIPVLSFLFLKGVCRHCTNHISPWHFWIEVFLGALFVGVVALVPELGPSDIFIRLFLLSGLFMLFVMDTRYGLLPDMLTLPIILFVFAYQWLQGVSIAVMLIAGAIGGGVFLVQWLISKGTWVGSGDIRLGVLMGIVLGVPGVLLALFIAYIVGALFAVVLLLQRKRKKTDTLPFGSFLIPATVLVWFFGETMLTWLL